MGQICRTLFCLILIIFCPSFIHICVRAKAQSPQLQTPCQCLYHQPMQSGRSINLLFETSFETSPAQKKFSVLTKFLLVQNALSRNVWRNTLQFLSYYNRILTSLWRRQFQFKNVLSETVNFPGESISRKGFLLLTKSVYIECLITV